MANTEPESGLVRRLGMLDASNIVIGEPVNSGKGVFLILTGLPVYFYWKKKLSSLRIT